MIKAKILEEYLLYEIHLNVPLEFGLIFEIFLKMFFLRMLRHARKLAPQCHRRVHDYESLCGQGGQIYGPDHLAMQEIGF